MSGADVVGYWWAATDAGLHVVSRRDEPGYDAVRVATWTAGRWTPTEDATTAERRIIEPLARGVAAHVLVSALSAAQDRADSANYRATSAGTVAADVARGAHPTVRLVAYRDRRHGADIWTATERATAVERAVVAGAAPSMRAGTLADMLAEAAR